MAYSNHRQNDILAGLPNPVIARVLPRLERVSLAIGDVLFDAGVRVTYAVFPTTAIVSLLCITRDGSSSQIAAIGREGVVGAPLFPGGSSTSIRAVVHGAGEAFRLRESLLTEECKRGGPMFDLLLRYTQILVAQLAQTAVCNRYHSLDQQLCRLFLTSLDRSQSNRLEMTQELIANMLGVRRERVTESAGHLARAGFIEYHRGHITVLDRFALENLSCECYGAVKHEYDCLRPSAGPRVDLGAHEVIRPCNRARLAPHVALTANE